jgi:hypothetical protein
LLFDKTKGEIGELSDHIVISSALVARIAAAPYAFTLTPTSHILRNKTGSRIDIRRELNKFVNLNCIRGCITQQALKMEVENG